MDKEISFKNLIYRILDWFGKKINIHLYVLCRLLFMSPREKRIFLDVNSISKESLAHKPTKNIIIRIPVQSIREYSKGLLVFFSYL